MIRLFLIIGTALLANPAFAGPELVTCPQWKSAYQDYVNHPKRTDALKAKETKEFLALYRALAAILGSKRMNAEMNTELESSGYADLFDKLMSLHVRGGFPPDFVDAIERFHKLHSSDQEVYVIDVSTQKILEKFRNSYCK